MELRRVGEELFAKLGLSQTNFSFQEEMPPKEQDRSDSRRAAVVPTSDQTLQTKSERVEWNRKNLGTVYSAHGKKDPKWDSYVNEALELFAQMRGWSDNPGKARSRLREQLSEKVKAAFDAQCQDPMIRYLHLRFHGPTGEQANTQGEIMRQQLEAAEALEQSAYPPIRKFYGAVRANNALHKFVKATEASMIHRLQTVTTLEHCLGHLRDVLQDPTTPRDEALEATQEFLDALDGPEDVRGAHFAAVHDLLLKHHSKSGLAAYFKGVFYVSLAWSARGNEYAYKVTDEGWKLFAQRLAVASASLNESWDLNPSAWATARKMLTVELGQGEGRPRLEQWFRRAMKLNPNSYNTVSAKLYYLEPKWHGSEESMLAFGRQCLEFEEWGGETPYLTVHAHETAAKYREQDKDTTYWKDPEVWKECEQAFEKLFRMDIDTIGYHHNYALIAYRCGKWKEFERERTLLGKINYKYFGGKNKYDTMVTNAAAQLSQR